MKLRTKSVLVLSALALAAFTVSAPLQFVNFFVNDIVQPWFDALPTTSQENIRLFAKYVFPSIVVAITISLGALSHKRAKRSLD